MYPRFRFSQEKIIFSWIFPCIFYTAVRAYFCRPGFLFDLAFFLKNDFIGACFCFFVFFSIGTMQRNRQLLNNHSRWLSTSQYSRSWHTGTVVYFWSVDRVVSLYDDGNWRKLSSDSLIPQLWNQWAALPSSPPRTHTPPPPPPFQQLENELSFDRLRRKLLNIHFQLMISFAVNKKN